VCVCFFFELVEAKRDTGINIIYKHLEEYYDTIYNFIYYSLMLDHSYIVFP